MSYLVLARKYRPQTFSEVVGQEHVTRTLSNAFASGRVHHAFLFCGPRGCGKTTLARIVGKALNCEAQGRPSPEPCGTCSACASINAGNAIDYQEMDGASNRGIDAIRELTEAVRYQPAVLRKKVYVIDEVHMLTTEAFNALLKTLEEPPPHVTFVLATTEPHKLPNTILSRCQRYDFKLVPASRLGHHLTKIFEAEKIPIEPNAVSLLVRESGGSVRDALSLSDQLISYVGATAITEKQVAEVLGVADRALTRSLVRALAGGQAGAALGAVESAIERGVDEVQLARAIVRYLRDLSVLQVAPDRPELVDAADEERTELAAEASSLERSRITQMFERMLRCCDELGKTLQPRLVLDCALIDVATVEPLVPLGDLIERLGELESRLIRGGARPEMRAPAPRAPAPQPTARAPAMQPAPESVQPSAMLAKALASEQHAGGGTTSSTTTVVAAVEAGRKPAPDFAKGTTPGQRSPLAADSRSAASESRSDGPRSEAPSDHDLPEPPFDDIPHAAGPVAAVAEAAGRKPAPDFAKGTTPGQRDKTATTPQKPANKRGKQDFAAGSMAGGRDDSQAAAIADARTARDAALAESRARDGALDADPRASVPHAADSRAADPRAADPRAPDSRTPAIAESKRGPVPSASSDSRASSASSDSRGVPSTSSDSRPSSPVPSTTGDSRSASASMSPSGPVPAATTVASGSGPTEQLTASPTDVLKAWNVVLGELETRRKFSLLGPFQHARVMKWSADLIDLGFPVDVHSMGEMAAEKQNVDDLRSLVRELGPELAHVKISVRMLDAIESGQGQRSVLEDTRAKSSAERQKREAEAREHPITKHVLQTFGAQIKEIKTDV